MWQYEHAAETTASPEAIWELWSDVAGWGGWNPGIESIAIDGPFEAGSSITMSPPGEDAVRLRITEAVPAERFVDEADFGGVVVTTEHRIEDAGGERARVVYRMLISGPGSDEVGPRIGPQITADFPETIAALIARAEA
jgi:uncharacterized protein YndB with AHSA1/START domain